MTANDTEKETEKTPARPPVGYLTHTTAGLSGTQGIGYDYVLGQDGLYVQAEGPDLTARLMIAPAEIRGLAPVERKVELRHGPLPAGILEKGIAWFMEDPSRERLFAVRWEGGKYRPVFPDQEGRRTSLTYAPVEGAVAEFHSHGRLGAFFSAIDDRDEQGFRIYGVVGKLGEPVPQIDLRIGVYGYFGQLDLGEVFGAARGGAGERQPGGEIDECSTH